MMLITHRLTLSPLTAEDLPALERLANNRKIAQQIVNIEHPYTGIHASMRLGYVTKGFREKTRYCFAIRMRESQAFIGEISLHERDKAQGIAELGYWLGEPYWHQGFGSEAVGEVLNFGFTRANYATIYATCKPDNEASIRLLTKHGMHLFKEGPLQLGYQMEKSDFIANSTSGL